VRNTDVEITRVIGHSADLARGADFDKGKEESAVSLCPAVALTKRQHKEGKRGNGGRRTQIDTDFAVIIFSSGEKRK